jgi:hypothetical protein
VRFAVFQYPLDNPAAIRVSGKNVDLASEGFDDKLDVFSRDTLDSFLDNVVAILIFHALEDIGLELFNKFGLLIGENMFESLETLAR